MHIEQVELSSCLSSWHDQILEEAIHVSFKGLDLISPWLVLKSVRGEEVVEAHATFRDLDLAEGAHRTVEGNSVFRQSCTE